MGLLRLKFLNKVKAEIRRYQKRKAFKLEIGQAQLPKIAVCFTGGLGDIINSTRFLRDLIAECGPFEFDLYTPRLDYTKWVTAGIPGIMHLFNDMLWHEMRRHYRMAFEVSEIVVVRAEDWHRCGMLNQNVVQVGRTILDARQNIELFVTHHPRLDNQLARIAVLSGWTRRNYMHAMARIPYGGDALNVGIDKTILKTLGLAGAAYITVHNGFDTLARNTKTSTKVYPHFKAVVDLLKDAYPGVAIVQLGHLTSTDIPGVDINLIGKSSLEQTAALLHSATLHLDNESGLVHLASCVGGRSAVFFGPTDIDYFSYPQNINFPPAACGRCWCLSDDWNTRCLAGYAQPICLSYIKPESVLERVAPILMEKVVVVPPNVTPGARASNI